MAPYSFLQTFTQDLKESNLHDAKAWLHFPTLPITLCYMLLRMLPVSLKQLMCVCLCGCDVDVLRFKHAICFHVYKYMHMLIWKINVGESMWVTLSLSHCSFNMLYWNYTYRIVLNISVFLFFFKYI